jgi:hypothetical protein
MTAVPANSQPSSGGADSQGATASPPLGDSGWEGAASTPWYRDLTDGAGSAAALPPTLRDMLAVATVDHAREASRLKKAAVAAAETDRRRSKSEALRAREAAAVRQAEVQRAQRERRETAERAKNVEMQRRRDVDRARAASVKAAEDARSQRDTEWRDGRISRYRRLNRAVKLKALVQAVVLGGVCATLQVLMTSSTSRTPTALVWIAVIAIGTTVWVWQAEPDEPDPRRYG